MKRSSALVEYASSGDEGEKSSPARRISPPPKKRRLPTLVSSLTSAPPKDNPALHQGRVRNTPHIEGQYAAYVYVPVKLALSPWLHSLFRKAVKRARDIVPIIHPIGLCIAPEEDSTQQNDEELHISLTRPIYLRAHQREGFITALRGIAKAYQPFQASFATFSELTNDERTRTFLTAEIGAGHTELKSLCDALTPVLRTYRQKEFYTEPRFHASIAWALLESASKTEDIMPASVHSAVANEIVADKVPTTSSAVVADENSEVLSEDRKLDINFPTIPHFPPELVSTLEAEFGSALRAGNVGSFDCEDLCVRIGKNVTRWKLSK